MSVGPPFIPECEVLLEGGPEEDALFASCPKNPGHSAFIPVGNLSTKHLPAEWQTQEHMDSIQYWCNMIVKVVIIYTSPDRPDTFQGTKAPYPYVKYRGNSRVRRIGTGYVDFLFKPSSFKKPVVVEDECPCHLCKTSGEPKSKYLVIYIITATHVIYDDSEAVKAVFEFFYNSEERRDKVRCMYGISVMENDDEMEKFKADTCKVKCVTHDETLIEWFLRLRPVDFVPSTSNQGSSSGIAISHPHGRCKHVTIGKILHSTISIHSLFPTGLRHSFGNLDKFRLPSIPDYSDDASNEESQNSDTHVSKRRKIHKIHLRASDETLKQNGPARKRSFHFLSAHMIRDKVLEIDTESSESSEVYVERGTEYYLPFLSFEIPKDSEYFYRVYHPRETYFSNVWIRFPPGTRFFLVDDTELFTPPDIEFCSTTISNRIRHNHVSFGSYSIDTCPGSSGAPVIYYPYKCDWLNHVSHAGAQRGGSNRSCFVQNSGM